MLGNCPEIDLGHVAPGCPANATKFNRPDMASLTFHCIDNLPNATGREHYP
jgi:hypothetical protein